MAARRNEQVNYTADAAADPFPGLAAKFAGARSIVGVPMLNKDVFIGAVLVYRQEVRPFGDRQIVLLTNFAAHAVIAIEAALFLSCIFRAGAFRRGHLSFSK
jgi:GAF domain-containing protein